MPEHNQPRNESNLALDVLESGAAYKVRVHDILKLGIEITILNKAMTIKHTYTQFRVTLHVYNCRFNSGQLRPNECEQWKWVKPTSLEQYPFPAANVKIVQYLINDSSKISCQTNIK